MNNYMDSARTLYRSIPLLSPALNTDLQGNYKCEIDYRIANNRLKFFYVLWTGSLASLAALTKFSSITVLAGFATPLAIAVGIVALGVLGCSLDEKLTYRAANNLAIEQYLTSDNDQALDWLLADMSRIRLLIKNVDLSERDSFVRTLMEKDGSKLNERCGGLRGFSNLMFRAGRDADNELFSLFWNQCNDKDKINAFTAFLGQVCQSEKDSCKKNLDFIIDNKMISPEIFTDQQQFNLMYYCLVDLRPTANSLKYLERLTDLGFDIDVKNDKGQSIRDFISHLIFKFALDDSSFRKMHIEVGNEKSVLRAIGFLQAYENKKSGLLVDKRVLEVEDVWTEDKLEAVAPYLTGALENEYMFRTKSMDMFGRAILDDNVKIGSILWGKSNNARRKEALRANLITHKNPKLAISLMKAGLVSSKTFSEEEQFCLLHGRFYNYYEKSECTDLLVEIGFNFRAKHTDGKTVREFLIDQIATNIIHGNVSQSDRLIKSLELVDKILEKQNIATGLVLKQGQASDNSNLSIFPDDILNCIVQAMVATH